MRSVILTALFASFLAGCTTSSLSPGQRTSVNVGFYDVTGRSFEEIDEQIALHGPTVKGVGKAIASTNIRMIPDIRFEQKGDVCFVSKASVKVDAKVTLPRLSGNDKSETKLRKAFDNLENYARLHEAVHVSIADQYAEMAEEKIRSLPERPNCVLLEADAVRTFKAVMAEHEKAQLAFDEREKVRIEGV